MKYFYLLCLLGSFSVLADETTSDQWRKTKKHEANFQLGHDYHMFTQSVGLFTAINPDNRIGIKVGSVDLTDEYQYSGAVQFKHFEGKTLYIAGEVYYINYRERRYYWTAARGFDRHTSIGTGIRLGNQGQWKDFTVGCDWIGVGHDTIHFNREGHNRDTTFTILNAYIGLSI